MKNWMILLISLLISFFIGEYAIFMYSFNHFEASAIALTSMIFFYLMLRLNRIDKRLEILVGGDEE